MVIVEPCKRAVKDLPSYEECMAFVAELVREEKERKPIVVPDGYTLASWADYRLDLMRNKVRIRAEIKKAQLEARIDELLAAGFLVEPGVKQERKKESPNRTENFLDEDEYSPAVLWAKARNLDDPRNKHRIKCVIGFLWGRFKGSRLIVRAIGADELRAEWAFGESKSVRPLRDCLLVQVGKWVAGKKFNRYKLNVDELLALADAINWSADQCLEYFVQGRIEYYEEKYWGELITGEFTYFRSKKKMSSRVYHEIINECKFVRNRLMKKHGYRWQYDVKSAFPTLAFFVMRQFRPNVKLPMLEILVSRPDEIRKLIADELDVSVPQVKAILSSMLFGAKLNKVRDLNVLRRYSIFEELEYDLVKWDKLRGMEFIKGFKSEIETLKLILPQCLFGNNHLPTPYAGATGYKKLYWVCEHLEKIVRDWMSNLIHERGGRVLMVHDCVVSDLDLSVDEVIDYVKEKTNGVFEVKLSKMEY